MVTSEVDVFLQESKLRCEIFLNELFSLFSDAPVEDLEYGWCFLENVEDPTNPAINCYEDTQWSEVDGR